MTLILADAILLLSVYKPILFGVVVGCWAYVVGYIDKDAEHFYLKRQMWNAIHVGVGVLAFFLWLTIPFFWLGLPLTLLLTLSGFVGYHFYRSKEVPPDARWRMSLDSFRQRWDTAQAQRVQEKATVVVIGADGQPLVVPGGEDPLVPVHEAFANLIDFALPRRAQRIDVAASATETAISVHIDGVKYPQTNLEANIGIGMIDYLKEHAGIDVSDRRRKLTGMLQIIVAGMGKQKFELTTFGSTKGLNLVIEINPHLRSLLKYEELGLLDIQNEQLMPVLDENLRSILVVCPADQGMTSTLYGLVGRHDPYTQNILTLEHEINHELEGVTHNKIELGTDAKPIDQQLRALLLREPRVILLGNLTDQDTAKQIPPHCEDMRFYVGMRQTDAFTALRAWMQAVGNKPDAAKSLGAIVAQRLVRKLCTTCRIAYQPDPAILRKLNLSADNVQQLYKHSGQIMVKEEPQTCPDCKGLGYRGRMGIFEVMVFDDDARTMLADGQLDQLRSYFRKNKMYYLQETALTRVVEGMTSISEITRVLTGEKKKKT